MKIKLKLAALGLFLLPVLSTVYAQKWEYQVKTGDTLWSIADEYLISDAYVNRLKKFNAIIDPLILQPGTTILAPVEWLGNLPGSASVISITGEVEAVRNDQRFNVISGFKVEADDKIITGEKGVAVLEFSDKSTLSIYSNTHLSFNKLNQSYDGTVVKSRIFIESGRLKINSNPVKKKGHRLEIESPAAVTAVRGTEFRIGVDETSGGTVTEVLSGNVAVKTQQNDVALQKHYGTKTETGKASIKPVKLLQPPVLNLDKKIESIMGKVSWESLEKAQSYRVRVARDEELKDIIYDQLVSSTQVKDVFFSEDGTFYSSVRAVDVNDIEGLDSFAKITVNARPQPPLIIEPKDNSSSFDGNPVFSWTIPSDSTAQLQYQLSNNKNFEPLLIDETIKPAEAFSSSSVLLPGDYYWRIAGIDNQGRGPFSKTSKISVVDQPLLTPEIAESGSLVSLSLSSNSVVPRYRVQVGRDEDFNEIVFEDWVEADEFSFNTKGSGSYYIRLGIERSESSDDIHFADAQKIIVPYDDWKQLMISIATGLLIIL